MIWFIRIVVVIILLRVSIFKPLPKIQDDFFGQLIDEGANFTGHKMFKPVNKVVEILIEKEILRFSTDKQKAFFKK